LTSLLTDLRRQHRRELFLLGLIGALVLIPWLVGIGAGFWLMSQQGWAWYWWAGSIVLLTLALALARRLFRPRPPVHVWPRAAPGASAAEQRAREALRERAAALTADDLRDVDAAPALVQSAFHDVAAAYSPDDPVALWRFTLPELLLLVEDFAQRLRGTILADFPLLRHMELSWAVKLADLGGPLGRLLGLYRILQWVNPVGALTSELRGSLARQAIDGFGNSAKVQLGVMLIEQAGETAIKLYSGGYRRRADELLPTAPTPLQQGPAEPLTVLLAGRRNAGKSALLNALLGKACEPVGLLTATTAGCRAYDFDNDQTGPLVLVDCPGAEAADGGKPAWLRQAAESDLVIWVAAADRADRAVDERALAALDALGERRQSLRPVPRIVALTHADRLDPPLDWEPPYDIDQGQRPKEQQMRAARQAACAQLGIPEHAAAVVAARPGEPLWNAADLYRAIGGALPEATQKRLERSRARDGRFGRVKDAVLTLPTVYTKTVVAGRTLAGRVLGRLGKRGATDDAGKR
jgi:uncharacterized protein